MTGIRSSLAPGVSTALCALLCACSNGNPPPPPPPPTGCTGVGPVATLTLPIVQEVEPNDDTATAFPVPVPTPPADGSVGLHVNGSVHDAQDPVDTISFTAPRTARYFFKLCGAACNIASGNNSNGDPDSLNTGIAHIDVLDAGGLTIGSTMMNTATENHMELCVGAGVITYIVVRATDTMNAVQGYQVTAIEDL